MEEKALKFAAYVILACTVATAVALPFFPQLRARLADAREERAAVAEFEENQNQIEMQSLAIVEEETVSGEETNRQLKLRLPAGVDGSRIVVINDYVTQRLRIEIPEIPAGYFESFPIVGSSNHIDTLSYMIETENSEEENPAGVLEISLDQVYELDMDYDDTYYYFDFLTPEEVYDKVVVIDAGHGGGAPGAIKQGVMEKDIDLAIVLKLKEIFEENDNHIGVYYTRTDDSNPTFEQRVQLANKSNADLFISIHNNSLGNGTMSATKGTQVMYNEESDDSKWLAQICLDEVTEALGSRKLGLIDGNSIYIIRNSRVPVALIEVGFMTNQEELELLQSEDYQKKTAEGIYEAILQYLESK